MKFKTKLFITLFSFSTSAGVFACASCGCSVNSDLWAQGMGSNSGWTFDVRYDYLNQNQLRSGTNTISPSIAQNINNPQAGGHAEVEGYTRNNYLTSSLDYNNGETWGVTVVLPFIQREHMTYGVDGWPSGGAQGYKSQTTGLGDVKVIGRYFGFSEQKNWGLQFGLKLPTGNNAQTGVLIGNGQITAVDPGLQLGTGSTDLIAGIYRFGHIQATENWGYFANLQFQATVAPKSTPTNIDALQVPNGGPYGSYRPGNSLNMNGGINYQGFDRWTPMLQFNFIDKRTDSGNAADTWSTGGALLYVTPGVLYSANESSQFYANVQLPIYQNLNGIQIAPTFIGSVGVRLHF